MKKNYIFSLSISLILAMCSHGGFASQSLDEQAKQKYETEINNIIQTTLGDLRAGNTILLEANLEMVLVNVNQPRDTIAIKEVFPFFNRFVIPASTTSPEICASADRDLLFNGRMGWTSKTPGSASWMSSGGKTMTLRLHPKGLPWFEANGDWTNRVNNKVTRAEVCPHDASQTATLAESFDLDLSGLKIQRYQNCTGEYGCKGPDREYEIRGGLSIRKVELPSVISYSFAETQRILTKLRYDLEGPHQRGADFYGDELLWFGTIHFQADANGANLVTQRCHRLDGRACGQQIIGQTAIDLNNIENRKLVDLWIQP